jgi:hypothetical protein
LGVRNSRKECKDRSAALNHRVKIMKVRRLSVVLALSATVLPPGRSSVAQSSPDFSVYPAPGGVPMSPFFSVTVSHDGTSAGSPFYETVEPASDPGTGITPASALEKPTDWTSFSASGPVTVRITNIAGGFRSARILPSHTHITPIVQGKTVRFVINGTRLRQVSVEFCYHASACTDATEAGG